MPNLDDNKDEIIDPVVLAAMIEDPDEDDDDKKRREELGLTDTVVAEDDDEDEDDEDSEDEEEDEEADDEKKTKKKKPLEAEDDEDSEEEDDDEDEDEGEEDDDEKAKKTTRKVRRQNREDDFLKSVTKDGKRPVAPRKIPEYKPIQYDEDGKEFKPDELEEDRELHGAVQFAKGAEAVRYWAEQDQFWSELEQEGRLVSYNPEINFLSEELPNGKKNPDFDPEKAEEVNANFLAAVGFRQYQKTDEAGVPQFDQNGQPIIIRTVDRTDISYEKYAARYVQKMKKWASEEAETQVDEAKKNFLKQKKKRGVTPNSGTRKSIGSLKLGDISKMSDEEFEASDAETDRQILNMLQ